MTGIEGAFLIALVRHGVPVVLILGVLVALYWWHRNRNR